MTTRRVFRGLVALGASALLLMSWFSPTAAAPTPPNAGARTPAHPVNTNVGTLGRGKDLPRTRLHRAQLASSKSTAGGAAGFESNYCGSCTPPLLHGQGPVMGTRTVPGDITVYTIFWAPTGRRPSRPTTPRSSTSTSRRRR